MSAVTQRCPECDGAIDASTRETVCTECGLVVDEDQLDRGPEWRSFEDDSEEKARTGAPLTRSRHDRGLSTEIGRSTRLKGRKRRQMARLRREHSRAQTGSKRDRNQRIGFIEIRRLVSQLDLSTTIRDRACVLFESAQEADLLVGRSIEGFAAAAVYATCRTGGIARTVEEVAADAQADGDELRVAYDAINRELGLPTGPIDPREYLARFASQLDLRVDVERRARELATFVVEENLAGGRAPSGVAAACLYTAAREGDVDVTQREVADVAGVAPATLRSTYQDVHSNA